MRDLLGYLADARRLRAQERLDDVTTAMLPLVEPELRKPVLDRLTHVASGAPDAPPPPTERIRGADAIFEFAKNSRVGVA